MSQDSQEFIAMHQGCPLSRDLGVRNELWNVPTNGPEKNWEVKVDRFHEVQYRTNALRKGVIIKKTPDILSTMEKGVSSIVWARR